MFNILIFKINDLRWSPVLLLVGVGTSVCSLLISSASFSVLSAEWDHLGPRTLTQQCSLLDLTVEVMFVKKLAQSIQGMKNKYIHVHENSKIKENTVI